MRRLPTNRVLSMLTEISDLRKMAKTARDHGEFELADWCDTKANDMGHRLMPRDNRPIPRITPEGNLFTDAIKSGKNK